MQAEHSRPTGPPEHSRVVQPRTQHGQQARHHDDSSLAAHSWPASPHEHSSLVLPNTISSPLKHSRPAGPPRRAGICAQHAPAAHPQPAASASIQILSSRIQSVLAFTGKPHRTQVDSTGRPARAFKFCPSTSNPRPLFKFSTGVSYSEVQQAPPIIQSILDSHSSHALTVTASRPVRAFKFSPCTGKPICHGFPPLAQPPVERRSSEPRHYGPSGSGRAGTRIVGWSPDKPIRRTTRRT